MAANYWESSQFQRFLLTRYELAEIESTHMMQLTTHEVTYLRVYFANLILKLGNKLRARQEIIATAMVYFKRFYINNTYYDIDPYLMAVTCVYLACKVEENPHHIKHIWSESKAVYAEVSADIRFPYDIPDIAECESYLLEEMKFYLVTYHPYQVLIESIINDSFRTDLALVYPPHVIAVASLFLSRVVDQGNMSDIEAQQWFADLNVDITDVLQVVSDLIELYKTWNGYDETKMPELVTRYIADIAASSS
ncbi:RNA polymerase II holoenzyme cyclin-like subunit [Coemansia sp. RSA 1933]|nr:RNA polymerase II holoenzyme cyclin-like subunit [Coemansia sp. RSA 1933]